MDKSITAEEITFDDFKKEILKDYKTAVISRECSVLGRREVLTGKAKFGIFGDGKELPQLAWAKVFKNGDFRSGYYRDQTFMMAIDRLTIEQFFAGLYAHPNIDHDPFSAGRQMGGHFATHLINRDNNWNNLVHTKNVASDISPTASQMPKLLGLAQTSKLYRNLGSLESDSFSNNGNEVAWGTIGNASTSEGLFFETINAAGVLQVPMVVSVWDDEYGISVPAKYQTTKESISEILAGFQRNEKYNGYEILKVKGWDYPALISTYQKAEEIARNEHVPVLIHVTELTQPQGHSTSGSHERYKSTERLAWEKEFDCISQMRKWILENGVTDEEDLKEQEREIKKEVKEQKLKAWKEFLDPINKDKKEIVDIIKTCYGESNIEKLNSLQQKLDKERNIARRDIMASARQALVSLKGVQITSKSKLKNWTENKAKEYQYLFSSDLYNEGEYAARNIKEVLPLYDDTSQNVDGRVVLRNNFDFLLEKNPKVFIFGEDSGFIGDVNQGLEGLQKKFGELRVADTGIREATIIGQGIGLALRGLRPIAEIQYLDYILYAMQILSDDLATLSYRTKGRQRAPLIVRTRGHRLEGIWHSGSPLGSMVSLFRGMHILVPRNMTKAAGFYNTLLEAEEPAVIVECLNGYRKKEKLPINMGEFKTPIGKVEILTKGEDLTIVSYGSTLNIVVDVAKKLLDFDIHVEIIDVQSLLPLDIDSEIKESVKKTNKILIVDEDVPGGASAYILSHLLQNQKIFKYLDSAPQTLTAKEHRPAYGTDGDYFSKPSEEDIFESIYEIMHEYNPAKYPH